jgi:aspartate-semialdehyde dehydrogenase
MSSPTKTAAQQHLEPSRGGSFYRVAIVGAGTLKGKEIAEVLSDRNFPALDIKLLDDDESLGQLEAAGDEMSFIQSVRGEQFANVDFTFFAADADSTRSSWKVARDAGSTLIDLSSALESEPNAVVRSPWLERQLGQTPAPELQPGPVVAAHPAAVVLALLLSRVARTGKIKSVVATVFEPASEHGQKGMDELHEQTVNLLSFQTLPKKVFDAQVAFNMLKSYGEQSTPTLASVESRIYRHYQKIVGQSVPSLSLRLLQVPVFHAHAFSLHIEMDDGADLGEMTTRMAGEHVVVSTVQDVPSNVSAAGQSDILVTLDPDEQNPNGFWIWAAGDNLRIAAATAVECAEAMASGRPKGKVQ